MYYLFKEGSRNIFFLGNWYITVQITLKLQTKYIVMINITFDCSVKIPRYALHYYTVLLPDEHLPVVELVVFTMLDETI